MGRVKWEMMEDGAAGFIVGQNKWVCADEFPFQQYLREDIGQSFEYQQCSYCDRCAQVLPLSTVVEKVYYAMEEVFESPSDSLPFESSDDEWDDIEGTGHHKEGAGFILPDSHHIMTTREALEDAGFEPESDELLDDISESICQEEWVYKDVFVGTDLEILEMNWNTFRNKTIEEARAGKSYDDIKRNNATCLDFITSALKSNLHSLSKKLSAGEKIYRCVNYKIVPTPLKATHLWAPPPQFSSSQRMSRKGQSRFYGSFDPESPVKEAVKNTTGETSCLATFELTQSVNVIDFTNLPEARLLNCPELLAYRFFNQFAEDITQRVEEDEKEKYIPTQIMRDIIEDKLKGEGIMGIKYRSVKGTDGENVVLFLDNNTCSNYLNLMKCDIIPQ